MNCIPAPPAGLRYERRGGLGIAADLVGRKVYTLGPGFLEAFEACHGGLAFSQAVLVFQRRFEVEAETADLLLRGCLAEGARLGLLHEVEAQTFERPTRRKFLPVALRAGLNGPRDIQVAAIPAAPPWRPEPREPSARKRG